jgi:hypothetical protein
MTHTILHHSKYEIVIIRLSIFTRQQGILLRSHTRNQFEPTDSLFVKPSDILADNFILFRQAVRLNSICDGQEVWLWQVYWNVFTCFNIRTTRIKNNVNINSLILNEAILKMQHKLTVLSLLMYFSIQWLKLICSRKLAGVVCKTRVVT